MQYKNKISIWGGRKSGDRYQSGYINEIVKEANDTALQGQNYVVRSTSNKLWSYAMLIMSYWGFFCWRMTLEIDCIAYNYHDTKCTVF